MRTTAVPLATRWIIVAWGFFFVAHFATAQEPPPPADAVAAGSIPPIAQTIRDEATRRAGDPIGLPLPLAATWNTGTQPGGYSPQVVIDLVRANQPILPWFEMPAPDAKPNDPYTAECLAALRLLAAWNLPFTLLGTQWEAILSRNPEFFGSPPDQNPNVLAPDGTIEHRLSPFGPVAPWQQAGLAWGQGEVLRSLQEAYPNPPLIEFLSNNEQPKLEWTNADKSRRFRELHPGRMTDEQIRQLFGDGYITRYRALQKGIWDGLSDQGWKDRSIFVGYNAFGPAFFGRWNGWQRQALAIPNRISPWTSAWDGASVAYYTNDWEPITDFTVYSPQIQAMNWVFMQQQASEQHPGFWFELSVWDGHLDKKSDKRAYYQKLGQVYDPARYGGMTQFGMWLLRPRIVRPFFGYRETVTEMGPYFDSVLAAVKRVHDNADLERFWRKGKLTLNPRSVHPYQSDIPSAYRRVPRWFLLDTSLTPPRPWQLTTVLPVYALALELGDSPSREWLVYAFSPLENRQQVGIVIPGLKEVSLDVPTGGAFYLVREADGEPTRIAP